MKRPSPNAGKRKPNAKRAGISIRITPTERAQIEALAQTLQCSAACVIRSAVREYLADWQGNGSVDDACISDCG